MYLCVFVFVQVCAWLQRESGVQRQAQLHVLRLLAVRVVLSVSAADVSGDGCFSLVGSLLRPRQAPLAVCPDTQKHLLLLADGQRRQVSRCTL